MSLSTRPWTHGAAPRTYGAGPHAASSRRCRAGSSPGRIPSGSSITVISGYLRLLCWELPLFFEPSAPCWVTWTPGAGPETAHKHEDPTNHGFWHWIAPYSGPWNQKVGSLCGLLGSY